MKISVYHSINPDFLATRNLHEFPYGYVHVANVECESIDEAFRDTNTINDYWGNNRNVEMLAHNCRSTSVGDVVETPTGHYRCEMVGWKHFKPLDHANIQNFLRERVTGNGLEFFVDRIKEPDGLMPMAHVLNPDDTSTIVAMPFSNSKEKRASFAALNKIMAEQKSVGVLFASECWQVRMQSTKEEDIDEERANMPESLGDVPGRAEILLLQIVSHGFIETRSYEILRDGDVVHVGEEEIMPKDYEQYIINYFWQEPKRTVN